jgi:hypothetical protein
MVVLIVEVLVVLIVDTMLGNEEELVELAGVETVLVKLNIE